MPEVVKGQQSVAVFFDIIAFFALVLGIGSLVYATEVSKRCQQMIDNRLMEIENGLMRKERRQERIIAEAVREMRATSSQLEARMAAQARDISQLAESMKPLFADLKARQEKERKIEQYMKAKRA